MKRVAVALALLSTTSAIASFPPRADAAGLQTPPAPCERLADRARSVPQAAWTNRAQALEPYLTIGGIHSGGDDPLGALPEVRKALDDEHGQWAVQVARIPDTKVYVASELAGTLHCQSSVFLQSMGRSKVNIIPAPPGWENTGLCWTQSADAGQVFGQPAFIEHGAISQNNDDESIRITPWTSSGWRAACGVRLHFYPAFKQTDLDCADPRLCKAAQQIAMTVVAAYERWPDAARDTGKFWYGPKPSEPDLQDLKSLIEPKDITQADDFPTQGSQDQLGYSYSGFALFPLALDGRVYVASIGHKGVGWRESDNAVLGIYARNGTRLTRLASFTIHRSIGGLKSVEVAK